MNILVQFVRFVGAGAVGLIVLLGVTYALTEFADMWYFWSYAVGTICGWTSIFFMNSFFTFSGHAKERYASKYILFVGMYTFAFAVNAGLVYVLTSLFDLYYIVSIIAATAITTCITFTFSKMVIFTYGNQD